MKHNTKINTKKTKKNTKIKKNTRLRKRTYKKVKNMRKNKKGGVRVEKRPFDDTNTIITIENDDDDDDIKYGYDDSYNNILNKIVFKSETDGQCTRITRSTGDIIKTVSLGKTNQTSFVSDIPLASDKELREFVDKIEPGPQIVSVPVPRYRHAFLVNVLPTKIMISDWKGNEKLQELQKLQENAIYKRRTRLSDQPPEGANWNQYYDFMKLLENKYPTRPIKFYEINKALKGVAVTKNVEFDGGGCAEYIYRWVEGILLYDRENGTNFFYH